MRIGKLLFDIFGKYFPKNIFQNHPQKYFLSIVTIQLFVTVTEFLKMSFTATQMILSRETKDGTMFQHIG